ncbi:MAG: cytochrome b/b6 domain-containing protein [Chloroflexota bacterium]
MKAREKDKPILRYDFHQRLQHIAIMVAMTMLGATGLPRAFPDWPTAQSWITLWGGAENAYTLHNYFGHLLNFTIFYHLLYLLFRAFVIDKKMPRGMLPTLKDARDFFQTLLYFLGAAKEKPRLGRYGCHNKIDYWLIFVGAPLLAITGICIFHADVLVRFFPPVLIAAMVAIHRGLALLLAGFVVIFHFYYVVLAPEVFPLNASIFTGTIGKLKCRLLYPLEYARIMKARGDLSPKEEEELKDKALSDLMNVPLIRALTFRNSRAARRGGLRRPRL